MHAEKKKKKKEKVFPPGIEPGTLSVLDSRDNHYTTETQVKEEVKILFINLNTLSQRRVL